MTACACTCHTCCVPATEWCPDCEDDHIEALAEQAAAGYDLGLLVERLRTVQRDNRRNQP